MRIKRVVKKKTASTRPTKKAASSKPAKKTAAKKTAAKGKPGPKREKDPVTGFSLGTDQYIIAQELMKGGESRSEVTERVSKLLDNKTRTGTPKPISNLVSSVYNNLAHQGFRTESSFKVLPPTPASKRKATLAKKSAQSK